MDVPDALIESIRCCAEGYPQLAEDELRVVVSDFARSAQAEVLREMADTLERRALVRYGTYNSTGFEPWSLLREKADELEAGAGQTGEGN